ncbi:carbon storage regulator [Pseudomonas stutzeri]|uniref:Carbon storage regulator n=1 Tax=Stutzerimonas stutzeri TaxID=316 RepID=A0A2N8RZ03_STUST|nr:carbon storage regulator [Stutzerimonas stutzeri]MCQ4297480.1 carbon storage regulator [Stutzerimonas stutzeri]PNF79618.1 carbon storage regulator [Stutzerimonas stutzeri]
MGNLTLTRREGEKIVIRVQPGTDAEELIEQLLLDGIILTVKEIKGSKARLSIDAPQDLLVLRTELEET